MNGFVVPAKRERDWTRVYRRFEKLMRNGIINDLDFATLRTWKKNFDGPEQEYLAAHLLDSLIYRSERMLQSSSDHVIHMVLPNALIACQKMRGVSLDDFLQKIRRGDEGLRLRFVPVDGTYRNRGGSLFTPVGKSGPTLMRLFGHQVRVHDHLLTRPEDIASLDKDVEVLVFVDDCLGTGGQFVKFARAYDLTKQPKDRALIYIPFIAHARGIRHIGSLKRFSVHPVETLGREADFFAGHKDDTTLWHRDKTNTVADVKAFYADLMKARRVSPEGPYSLSLSLVFHSKPPNNSLKAFWSTQGDWQPLFRR